MEEDGLVFFDEDDPASACSLRLNAKRLEKRFINRSRSNIFCSSLDREPDKGQSLDSTVRLLEEQSGEVLSENDDAFLNGRLRVVIYAGKNPEGSLSASWGWVDSDMVPAARLSSSSIRFLIFWPRGES